MDDMRRGVVLLHSELVKRGWLPKTGSFVMDAPPYSSVEELKRLAGCPLTVESVRGDIADNGIKRTAEREQMMMTWIEGDKELRPEEATDSEEEEDGDANEQKKEEQQQDGESEEEHEACMAALREETRRHIEEHKQQLQWDEVTLC